MSKNYVLDSSVYVKLLIPEENAVLAENLFAKIVSQESYILVPSIFLFETIGVFRKHDYDQRTIEEFIDEYYDISCVKVFDLKGDIIRKALEISETGNKKSGFPTFYDCVYHALAILNECDFVTADRSHSEKTKGLGNVRLLDDMKAISE